MPNLAIISLLAIFIAIIRFYKEDQLGDYYGSLRFYLKPGLPHSNSKKLIKGFSVSLFLTMLG